MVWREWNGHYSAQESKRWCLSWASYFRSRTCLSQQSPDGPQGRHQGFFASVSGLFATAEMSMMASESFGSKEVSCLYALRLPSHLLVSAVSGAHFLRVFARPLGSKRIGFHYYAMPHFTACASFGRQAKTCTTGTGASRSRYTRSELSSAHSLASTLYYRAMFFRPGSRLLRHRAIFDNMLPHSQAIGA